MDILLTWLFLAFIVERVTELITKMIPILERLKIKYVNIEMTLAFLISLLIAFGANLDFFRMFDIAFTLPYVGIVLSAVFMSGGSNVVHDIIKWIEKSKEKEQY